MTISIVLKIALAMKGGKSTERSDSESNSRSSTTCLSPLSSYRARGSCATKASPVQTLSFDATETVRSSPEDAGTNLVEKKKIITLKDLSVWKATMNFCEECDEWAATDSTGRKCSNCRASIVWHAALKIEATKKIQRITGNFFRQSLGDELVEYNRDWTDIVYEI